MISVSLPPSKSILSRLLILQQIHHVPLLRVHRTWSDDIKILRWALKKIERYKKTTVYLDNNGTALRFLITYIATTPDCDVVIEGSERLSKRPINALIEALLRLGSDIHYVHNNHQLPIRIRGKSLNITQTVQFDNPISSQFISSLLLSGIDARVSVKSPYVSMTEDIIKQFQEGKVEIERDWSSAAFWYEYVALHGDSIHLRNLKNNSIQGDKIVADIFIKLGVKSEFFLSGVRISKISDFHLPKSLSVDFFACPDLYPAVAITCWKLDVNLIAKNIESLAYKESDRIRSIREIIENRNDENTYRAYNDHRIAMSLLCADLRCDNLQCIDKSYPSFIKELKKVKNFKL